MVGSVDRRLGRGEKILQVGKRGFGGIGGLLGEFGADVHAAQARGGVVAAGNGGARAGKGLDTSEGGQGENAQDAGWCPVHGAQDRKAADGRTLVGGWPGCIA